MKTLIIGIVVWFVGAIIMLNSPGVNLIGLLIMVAGVLLCFYAAVKA